MSPEYAMDGNFSVKSDVFSFGVLLLEIVSGKKNRGFYHSNSELNLLGHVSIQGNKRSSSNGYFSIASDHIFIRLNQHSSAKTKLDTILGMETLEGRKWIGNSRSIGW